MRFESYIKYIDIKESSEDKDKTFISKLHKDCSIFLKSIKYGQKCFRGKKRGGISDNIEMFKPRSDRRPRDIPENLHDILNNAFKKKFGWYVRSEGVFCAPNIYIAEEYGRAYYFFPIGNFKMLYLEGVEDILQLLRKDHIITSGPSNWQFTPERVDDFDKYLKNLMNMYKQDVNNAKDALYSDGEIMCQCKSYYMADIDWVTKNFDEIFSLSKQ